MDLSKSHTPVRHKENTNFVNAQRNWRDLVRETCKHFYDLGYTSHQSVKGNLTRIDFYPPKKLTDGTHKHLTNTGCNNLVIRVKNLIKDI